MVRPRKRQVQDLLETLALPCFAADAEGLPKLRLVSAEGSRASAVLATIVRFCPNTPSVAAAEPQVTHHLASQP